MPLTAVVTIAQQGVCFLKTPSDESIIKKSSAKLAALNYDTAIDDVLSYLTHQLKPLFSVDLSNPPPLLMSFRDIMDITDYLQRHSIIQLQRDPTLGLLAKLDCSVRTDEIVEFLLNRRKDRQ